MFFYWLGFTFEDFLLGKLKSNSNLQVDETVKRLGSVMWIIKRIISTLELLGMPSVAYGLARYLSLIIYRKEVIQLSYIVCCQTIKRIE